ncbi:MAG: DUF721 domain-containing protein [Deltaproteobacteria bacterium]|nr:DUF721 domain-containing protein [Deltaproteobacteria bacterium]
MRHKAARGRSRGNISPDDARRVRIDSILSSSFASLGLDARLREYTLKKTWAECVGKSVSRKASPARLIGKTLYCAVTTPPWMVELNFHKQSIIKKLNERLGAGAVTEIIFRLGDVPAQIPEPHVEAREPRALTEAERRFIEETAEGIKDERLKDLIKRVMEKAKSEG